MPPRHLALGAALVLALVGCTTQDPATSTTSAASTPTTATPTTATLVDLASYEQQEPAWGPCTTESSPAASPAAPLDAECAAVVVPIDYDDPSVGDTVIGLLRVPATGTAQGSLLVNPGGPGDSGIAFARSVADKLPPSIRSSYDLVGFDPRGVGASAALECADTAELDAYIAADVSDPTPEEAARAADLLRTIGEGCETGSGALASHVTTVETAQDLDILRAVLGDERVTYLGKSYGTFLGATYAALFPERVGRMVLDGAVDPTLTQPEILLGQTSGFETALRAYAADCVASGECSLGETDEQVISGVQELLRSVDDEPLPSSIPGRSLTQTQAYYAITGALYAEELWPLLTQGLEFAAEGRADGLLLLADLYAQRGQDGYESNLFVANIAINCLDDRTKAAAPDIPVEEYEAASPTFGQIIGGMAQVGCGPWPLTTDVKAPDFTAPGAAPIVVIGTTRDPATLYSWSEALARMLDSGVLVTRDGDGHTGFLQDNACIDDLVAAYLVDGTVPADGTAC